MTEQKEEIEDTVKEIEEEEKPMWQKKREQMAENNRKAMKKLILVILLTLVFTGIEIAGGIMADSIAILSDAAHLVSDVFGLGVSVWAIHIATNNANSKYTYGYHRAEILGTLTSIFTIWAMTAYLVDEAVHRF